jgi:hypothetical protein
MIDKLADLLENFPRDPNRARCFNHVVALVAQKMVRQFDVPKGGVDAALDEAEKELRNLAEGIDIEEMLTKSMQDADEEDEDDEENEDGAEGEMSAEDRAVLDASMRPLRLVLVKVCSLAPDGAINAN